MRLLYGSWHPVVAWIREKYQIKPEESSVWCVEKEFNCEVIWDNSGDCYLEFKDERSFIMFVLRWA